MKSRFEYPAKERQRTHGAVLLTNAEASPSSLNSDTRANKLVLKCHSFRWKLIEGYPDLVLCLKCRSDIFGNAKVVNSTHYRRADRAAA
jgi:hypothetical protein